MKVEHGMDKFIYHPLYVLLVTLLVVPIDIFLVLRGDVIWGLILILMQVPWAISGFLGKFKYTAHLMGIDV